jgi:tetratricopeptide (TPR) repeat protein
MRVLLAVLLFLPSLIFRQDGNLEEAIRFYEKGEFSKAATLLAELSKSSPDEPKVRIWLGKTYIKTRQWDDAVREMEKATQIEPSNALYRLWLGRACGYLAEHTSKFTPWNALSRAKRVIREFAAASKLAPENLDIRFDMLDFYLQAPGVVGGGEDEAKAEVQKIATLDPQKGAIARAMMYKKDNKLDLAKKELIQATIDYPNYASGYIDLAEFLFDQKDFEGALKYAQKTTEMERSKRAKLISAAARIRLRTNLNEAEKSLQELASGSLGDYDPSFEEVYYWMGECHLAKGDKVKAREAFKTALAFDPDYEQAKKSISKLR